jgi:hypothetical protein
MLFKGYSLFNSASSEVHFPSAVLVTIRELVCIISTEVLIAELDLHFPQFLEDRRTYLVLIQVGLKFLLLSMVECF